MKITGIRVQLCHFPLPQTFSPSWMAGFPQASNGCAIYRVQTDEGIEGISASPLIADEVKGMVNLLRATLTGRDPTQVEDIFKILRSATRSLGLRSWHIEPACWDIIGKAANQPVWRLLGGAKNRIRAYCSFGEVRDGKQRIDDVAHVKELGFAAAKLRVRSMTIEEDVEQVRLVREAHPDFALMVDANMGWRVHGFGPYPEWAVTRAIRTARALEEYGIEWLEEPLDPLDHRGSAGGRAQTTRPRPARQWP